MWRVTVALPVGSRHEYRYLIDDTWKTDYLADGLAPNPYGTANSVVYASLPDGFYVAWSSSQVRERRCLLPAHTPSLVAPSQRTNPLGQRVQRTLAS